MKYTYLIISLLISFSLDAQDYIVPITKTRLVGNLVTGADSMTLEKVIGCSKFAVPNKAWSGLF